MRKWSELKNRKKIKRVSWSVYNFFRYTVYKNFLYKIWYWIKCHTITRYHIIDISGIDNYKYGWIDCDHAMLLASFKLLSDFVEKEDPEVGLKTLESYGYHTECLNLNEPCEKCKNIQQIFTQIEQDKKIRALYNWWHTERKENNWVEQHDIDTEKLIELIKLRGVLWT